MPEAVRRGRLKLLLGYAAGVGKTYQMLEEAQKLKRQGIDIVIGYFEAHGRKDTIAKTEGLQTVPRRALAHRGSVFEEMDVEAILRRRPEVCVVDEYAHTNVPGAERAKRWEDVQLLLEAGIDVLTNMNVQHLESLNDQVWQFTGVRVRETIQDWVIKKADEVVMVDLPVQALMNRLKRGVVYPPEKARQAMENFFKEPTLDALRELALRQTAHEVDMRQVIEGEAEEFLQKSGEKGRSRSFSGVEPADRILIHITPDPSTAALVRRGRRVADFLGADCFAVCVLPDSNLHDLPPAEQEALEKHLNFARSLQIETRLLQGEDVATMLVDFARRNQITQLFLLRAKPRPWPLVFRRNLVQQVARLAHDMQVIIVAERRRT